MTLLQMSFSGAVLVAVIVALRAALLYRLPKRTFAVLWQLALLRLLVPFSVPSVTSVYSLLKGLWHKAAVQAALPVPEPPAQMALWPGGPLPAAAGGSPAAAAPVAAAVPGAAQDIAHSAAFPWGALWLAGALVCAGVLALAYGRCRREFGTALPVEQETVARWKREHPLWRPLAVRQSDRIAAPLTYGIFRPVILLPKNTDWNNEGRLDYVLLHEYIHIRRWDAVSKLAAAAALCLHWFNPMAWALYFLFNRDIELACDEAVLRRQRGDRRADYAYTLIDLEERKSGLMPLCSGFGKNANEERITAIMKTRKGTVLAAAAACVVVAAVACVFATSPQARQEPEAPAFDVGAIQSQTRSIEYRYGDVVYRLTEQQFKEMIPRERIVWWSYEDYKAYVEHERARVKALVKKDRWSEKMAETYLAPFEQRLQAMEAGYMLTRCSEGNHVSILYTPEEYQQEHDSIVSIYVRTPYGHMQSAGTCQPIFGVKEMQEESTALREKLWKEALAPYAAFGVTWEWEEKWRFYRMYYQGREVRCIYDETAGTCISEGIVRGDVYYRDNVDLYAVYENGQLTGVRVAAGEERQDWTQTWQALRETALQEVEAMEETGNLKAS